VGKRLIADKNQNTAEPQAATITPVSMNDFIITSYAGRRPRFVCEADLETAMR
jgi:hypothetical protein